MDSGVFFARASNEPGDDTTVAETLPATFLVTPDIHPPVHYRVFQRLGSNQNLLRYNIFNTQYDSKITYISIYTYYFCKPKS